MLQKQGPQGAGLFAVAAVVPGQGESGQAGGAQRHIARINDVGPTEEQGAAQHGERRKKTAAADRFQNIRKTDPEKNLLGQHGQKRVKDHDQQLEQGAVGKQPEG